MSNRASVIRTFASRAKHYDDEFSWIHNKDFIADLVPPPFGERKFLDTCAGTGAVAVYAHEQGWVATATDIAEIMLDKISLPLEKVVADVCRMPFADSSFEVISCRQGLQYVDLAVALGELHRVAKKEVRSAHITIFSEEDLDFWKAYYTIASPGRVNVFLPDQIPTVAKQIGYKTAETHIKINEESYLAPIMYLPEDQQEMLAEMFLSASPDFLLRNHIKISEQDIRGERRWEFSTLVK